MSDALNFMRAARWPNDVAGKLMCVDCTIADGHDYRAHILDVGPPSYLPRSHSDWRAEPGEIGASQ